MYEFYSRHEEYWEDDTRLDEQLLRDINKAVNDEFSAIHYYTRLAELAPNNQFQQAILGIRQDEIKHFDWFSKAYYDLSGSYPQISLNIKLPHTFQEGVSESIKDEVETVPFYQSIARRITNARIQSRIVRAASDEQRHGQIFRTIQSHFSY
jgi:rubrerythrin